MKQQHFIIATILTLGCINLLAQPIAFAALTNAPTGKTLCFAYNSSINRLWVCTTSKVFYSDDNGTTWTNTASTGVLSPSAIALNAAGTPYIVTPQNGMRHYNGTAWIADNAGLPTSPMPQFTSLAIDASGNVYAGAGWHGLTPNYSGVWKWNGTIWATFNTGLPTTSTVVGPPEITSLMIDGSGNFFLGTAMVLLNGGGQGFGVYKWNGSSWASFGTGLSNLNVASLAVNASGELFAGTFNGISHISATSSGAAWTNVTSGLPSTATTVRSISFDASNNIYAGLGYLPEQLGSLFGNVYISNNNGASWTQSTNFANTTTAVNTMVTDNAGNVFAGASGIYKSTNQGVTWAEANNGITKSRSRGGYLAINSLGHLFSAGEGNISRSTDDGATWQLVINGIDRHDLTCIAIDNNDVIYLGGQTWVGGSVRSNYGRIWRSTDNGNTWTIANVNDAQMSEIKVNRTNNTVYVAHVFGTTSDLSATTDGINWTALNVYSNANPNGYGAFSVDVNKRNHVFATTESAQVRRSTDGGASFTSSTNLQGGNVQLVRISPHDNIFINGPAPYGTSPLFYSDSTNNGSTFTQATNFPAFKSITDIAYSNKDSIFVSTQSGLYTSKFPFNPATSIFSLNASAGIGSPNSLTKDKNGYLYMSYYYSGIIKSTLPIDAATVLPIELTHFDIQTTKTDAQLTWATSTETNLNRFEIERSDDKLNFNKIGEMKARGTSNTLQTYYFSDKNAAADAVHPTLYYRLKQMDINEQYTYSPIRAAQFEDKNTRVYVFPNPVNGVFTIEIPTKCVGSTYKITDSMGKQILEGQLKNTRTMIDNAHLITGVYFIHIIGYQDVVKFVVF